MSASLSSCGSKGPSKQEVMNANDSLVQVTLRQQNELADLMEVMDDVTNQLDDIAGRLPLANADETRTLENKRSQMLERLDILRRQVADKQAEIAEMQKKYSSVLSQNKELKKTVERMQQNIAAYEEKVVRYETELAEKNTAIENLSTELAEKADSLEDIIIERGEQQEIIERQDLLLNEGYYVVGTRSELKSKGLIVGGIFKASHINEKGFDTSNFKKVDIREFSALNLNVKSARILSAVPEGSYELRKQADGTLTLVVLDGAAFWSLSHYLVIVVK